MKPIKGKLHCIKCPPNKGHNAKRYKNYKTLKDNRHQRIKK